MIVKIVQFHLIYVVKAVRPSAVIYLAVDLFIDYLPHLKVACVLRSHCLTVRFVFSR